MDWYTRPYYSKGIPYFSPMQLTSVKYLWVLGATGYVGKHLVLELLER